MIDNGRHQRKTETVWREGRSKQLSSWTCGKSRRLQVSAELQTKKTGVGRRMQATNELAFP